MTGSVLSPDEATGVRLQGMTVVDGQPLCKMCGWPMWRVAEVSVDSQGDSSSEWSCHCGYGLLLGWSAGFFGAS